MAILAGLILLSTVPTLAADTTPAIDELITRVKATDTERAAALSGYTAHRRYKLDIKNRRASMLVRMTCQSGEKL